MCKLCELKPVYEFTNKRTLCKSCFVHWFQKKVLYVIRKFNMLNSGDKVGFARGKSFRDAVLEDVLKMYSEKGHVELKEIRSLCSRLIASRQTSSRRFAKKLLSPQNFKVNVNEIAGEGKKLSKLAISSTSDTETYNLISEIFNSKIQKHLPVEGKIIKPLYFFLDKEVLLYAKLRRLKFKLEKEKNKKDKLMQFVDELEKKHPEIKQATVNGISEMK